MNITISKYRRLCLVLFLPLLLLGFLASVFMPYPRYLTVFCGGGGCYNAAQTNGDNGPDSKRWLADVSEKEHHGWFDIFWKDDNSYIHPFVYASRRVLRVEIQQAVATAFLDPDERNFAKTLDGRRATIWLGLDDETKPVSLLGRCIRKIECHLR
jgi:hypothetical protein